MPSKNIRWVLIAIGAVALAALPSWSFAVTTDYFVHFEPLNNSGVTGSAVLTLIDNNSLTVQINARGLTPNQLHPQHIHGLPGGANSTIPTLACCDPDGDRFIEVAEGAAAYGPIIVNLTSPPGTAPTGFPTADASGVINFSQTYNLNDPQTFAGVAPPLGFSNADKNVLFPLENRHIVLHGLTVPAGPGLGTGGEVDGTAGYKLVLPVANGEINVVPEPASIGLFGTGLIGLGWIVRRRHQQARQ